MEKCRVCLQDTTEISFSLKDIAPVQQIPYEEVYFYVTNYSCDHGHQRLCWNCREELLAAYEFKKRCQRSETLFSQEIYFVKIEPDVDVKEEVETTIEEKNSHLGGPERHSEDLIKVKECKNENSFQCKELTVRLTDVQKKKSESEHGNAIQCPYCSICFKWNVSRVAHCKRKHPEKILKCSEIDCTYEYFFPYQISCHTTKAHGTEIQCDKCSKTFNRKRLLKQHFRTVHKIQIYGSSEKRVCPYCGKILKSFNSLHSHIQYMHPKTSETLVCDLCGYSTKIRCNFVGHMKRRHIKQQQRKEEPLLKCRYCPELFIKYFPRHAHEIRFHTKAFKHICHICGHKCIVRGELTKHMVQHTGEKNYVCKICNARFGSLSGLRPHEDTHTDTKTFVCSICQQAFKTKKSLVRHGAVHRERNYECPVCGQKFLLNKDMRIHVMRKHPEYELPPPGTVMSKAGRERLRKIELKKKQFS